MSLFDIHMPGILTLEQVRALDLDHWLLLVHGSFVHMIVSVPLFILSMDVLGFRLIADILFVFVPQDLVGWEKMRIEDPQSVKGIVAELAAALGPDLVRETGVVLFD